MENPPAEIKDIVRTLCTRPHAEQHAALVKYFTPDAEFVHPMCRVPPFRGDVPFLRKVQRFLPSSSSLGRSSKPLASRRAVAAIFRWYKIMSPHIELGFESVAWDRDTNTLFVALHQRFALWCVPLYAAHVRLVTELRLVPVTSVVRGADAYYAAAAGTATTTSSSLPPPISSPIDANTSRSRLVSETAPPAVPPPTTATITRYYITRQEDHYQVNEILKFFSMGLGACLWYVVQLLAAAACVGGAFAVDTLLGILPGGSSVFK